MFDWSLLLNVIVILFNLSLLFYILNEEKVRAWQKALFPRAKDSPLRDEPLRITIGKPKS